MNIQHHIRFNYLRQDSIVHRMDALSKLAVVTVISISLYFFQQPWQLAVFLFLLFAVALVLIRVEPLTVLFTFSIFILFGSFVFIFQLIGHQDGNALVRLGPLQITDSGLSNAAIFLFRMSSIGCTALIYLWTTKPKDFVVGLIRLGIPYRFAFAVLVALRFLPLINDEVRKVRDAHAIRGGVEGKGLGGALERQTRYLFPILANGIRKAETAAMAMESRGFGLLPTRTYIDEFHWTKSGLIFLACIVALVAIVGAVGGFQLIQPRYDQRIIGQ